MFGEHALQRKFVAYDRSVRVPLMMAFPGVFAPGTLAAASADTALVSNIDLLPTILSVTGIAPDPTLPAIDGLSLVAEPAGHPVLLSEYFSDPRYTTITGGKNPIWNPRRHSDLGQCVRRPVSLHRDLRQGRAEDAGAV